jgi:hypothetical protein
MAKRSKITGLGLDTGRVKVDRTTGYIRLVDVGELMCAEEGEHLLSCWMSDANTIAFFIAWEERYNPDHDLRKYEAIQKQAGLNAFILSLDELLTTGASGLYRSGNDEADVYFCVEWAIHFGNWLDPVFNVEMLVALRESGRVKYGEDYIRRILLGWVGREN